MSAENEGRQAAERFRAENQMGVAPIEDLVAIIDSLDIDVVFVRASNDEHGLTARDLRTGATVFVINQNLSSVRLRSTLAHELGHHVFGEDLTQDRSFEYTSTAETRAHSFARHLLLPLKAIETADINPEDSLEAILNIFVRRYGVSPQMAAFQLKNAKRIDSQTCTRLAKLSTGELAWKYGWSDLQRNRDEICNIPRQPRVLYEKATRAYLDGKLTATELAYIIGSSVSEVHKNLALPVSTPSEGHVEHLTSLQDDDLSDLQ